MKSSPRSLQLEKACVQQQRPNAAKKKKKSPVLGWWDNHAGSYLLTLKVGIKEDNPIL